MSTQDWSYGSLVGYFQNDGCTQAGCPYTRAAMPTQNFCAINLSDAILRAGYSLPAHDEAAYPACPHGRIRGADKLAQLVKQQNGGAVDADASHHPAWKAIVYFEGNFSPGITGHIDLWDGTRSLHVPASVGTGYWNATTVWFFKLSD